MKPGSALQSVDMPEGLLYASDQTPGFTRTKRGKSFVYRQADGQQLRDAKHIARIQKLAIPPAYTAVWICPDPRGHIQATGRDARGRKQYRYHADWRRSKSETKFDRLTEFAAALPSIRAKVKRDLAAHTGADVQRGTVLAAIARLLDTTLVRVGNDEYARSNGSFGLTTLRKRHVDIQGSQLRLRFRGKSGVQHDVTLADPRIARIVRRCQALPGQELFHYADDKGEVQSVGSTDVNDYLEAACKGKFTAKDFRTWHGSVLALQLWRKLGEAEQLQPTAAQANRLLTEVAELLGNTLAVCRKSYVHPRVLALLAGETGSRKASAGATKRRAGLTASEQDFLALLADSG
ncbi:DNA topoisomerase-1 [Actimicrobium sp. GrIS 1.19]|uniref:DNA topoisomerase IB n=1 Tax=Actimicrobium sp. GrIS 1.19 TaxID=3071708 RepID=UPI002E091DAE|nr:DNA topoisomerase-1 [Actimicrobium sp. GrIS 1.19]